MVPQGGDITGPHASRELSPLLRRIRAGKRGADRLEESLARGIRKAKGQWVTPRKKRKKDRRPVVDQAPDWDLEIPQQGSPGQGEAPSVDAAGGAGNADGRRDVASGVARGRAALSASSAVPPGDGEAVGPAPPRDPGVGAGEGP